MKLPHYTRAVRKKMRKKTPKVEVTWPVSPFSVGAARGVALFRRETMKVACELATAGRRINERVFILPPPSDPALKFAPIRIRIAYRKRCESLLLERRNNGPGGFRFFLPRLDGFFRR